MGSMSLPISVSHFFFKGGCSILTPGKTNFLSISLGDKLPPALSSQRLGSWMQDPHVYRAQWPWQQDSECHMLAQTWQLGFLARGYFCEATARMYQEGQRRVFSSTLQMPGVELSWR